MQLLDLLTRLCVAALLALGLLLLGPVLAWCATNQAGPLLAALVLAAQSAPRPGMGTPALLPARVPAPALPAPFSPDALLRSLLATEVR